MKVLVVLPDEWKEWIKDRTFDTEPNIYDIAGAVMNGVIVEDCEDCISRQDVLRLFATHDGKYLYKAIQELSSVYPKQKIGYWRPVYQGDEIINYRCSECEWGNTFGKNTYGMNYCPRCGLKMRVKK